MTPREQEVAKQQEVAKHKSVDDDQPRTFQLAHTIEQAATLECYMVARDLLDAGYLQSAGIVLKRGFARAMRGAEEDFEANGWLLEWMVGGLIRLMAGLGRRDALSALWEIDEALRDKRVSFVKIEKNGRTVLSCLMALD